MDRRSFIKLTAVSGTSAALASCGAPQSEIIRFVPDEDIMPGVATLKPGVCTLCASGCGLSVRMMMADADVVRNGQAGLVRIHAAKKLEGRADHPVNHGGGQPEVARVSESLASWPSGGARRSITGGIRRSRRNQLRAVRRRRAATG